MSSGAAIVLLPTQERERKGQSESINSDIVFIVGRLSNPVRRVSMTDARAALPYDRAVRRVTPNGRQTRIAHARIAGNRRGGELGR